MISFKVVQRYTEFEEAGKVGTCDANGGNEK
jgi:hypothetical protein